MIKKSIASLLIILILINSIGCYSYSQINTESAVIFKEDDKVKITTLDEKIYILYNVKIGESEIKGVTYLTHSEKLGDIRGKEVVIPTEQIKRIEVEKHNTGRTVLAVVLIVGIPIAVLAIVVGNQMAKGGYR